MNFATKTLIVALAGVMLVAVPFAARAVGATGVGNHVVAADAVDSSITISDTSVRTLRVVIDNTGPASDAVLKVGRGGLLPDVLMQVHLPANEQRVLEFAATSATYQISLQGQLVAGSSSLDLAACASGVGEAPFAFSETLLSHTIAVGHAACVPPEA